MQYSFTKSITGFIPILLCTLGLILGSCGGSTGPNGGNSNGSGNGGNGIATEPTFSNVQQIFQQSCGGSGCHISETTNGVRLDTYDNVIESRGTSYGELIVQPGDASGSPLIDKIEPNPDIGSRMPENGNYLSEDRIDQIRQWINDGAENN